MRKMISSPAKMPLSEVENQIYQKCLNLLPDLMLNLMAVKVSKHPEDFATWCAELCRICREEINYDLLEPNQLPPLKKLQDTLEMGVSVAQMKMLRIAPWPIFSDFIMQNAQLQAVEERIALLDYLKSQQEDPLAQMIEEDRLAFAGKHTIGHDIGVYKFDVEWFGSTKGAKVFHQLLQNHAQDFDTALAFIPKTGEVNFQDYDNFVKAYVAIFSEHSDGEKAPLMPATRLLAMRRPDQFIAVTNTKVDAICQGFNIVKLKPQAFNDYWDDLICTLRAMSWWNAKEPQKLDKAVLGTAQNQDEALATCDKQNLLEAKLWQYRAVLVDLFLFADKDTALKSNYLRAVQKAENKANRKVTGKAATKLGSMSLGRKRTKESAEVLVDKALESEDLPPYMKGKRDSIVKAVKEGKSVDAVIKMMSAIFG